MITVSTFGTIPGHAQAEPTRIDAVDLVSASLRVRIITLGASIASVHTLDANGRLGPVHLQLNTATDYADPALNPHLGGSIGRYANRIAGARFPMDGRSVELEANKGAHHLHGGVDGFDRRVWALDSTSQTSQGGAVTLSLISPDGDQGYPGTVTVTATYELSGDRLRISYCGRTDAPTVLNMTNHGYWNLDGAATVEDHHLALAADYVLPVDPDGIPTGTPVGVEGTAFDLRTRARLGPVMAALAPGLDHCFAVRGTVGQVRAAAVVDSPTSGRWMGVLTDQPALQVYTGNGLRPPFQRHGSVSLETQLFPDTPNRPALGSAVLLPSQDYVSLTELRFGVGTPPAPDDLKP